MTPFTKADIEAAAKAIRADCFDPENIKFYEDLWCRAEREKAVKNATAALNAAYASAQQRGADGHGIYIASKTSHAWRWKRCRENGANIISTWIDESGVGETSDFSDLWLRCVSEASSCAALICYRA